MDLTQHVEELRHQLELAAEAGGDDARVVAGRLTAALESAARLVLLDAISAAAAEITLDLAPGSVDVRLRGRDPEFVVTPPPVDHPADSGPTDAVTPPPTAWGSGHRRRRHRSVAHHVAPARAAQGPDRAGRRARRPVGQLVAGTHRLRRGRGDRPATTQHAVKSTRRPELHRLGPLAAPGPSHRSRSRRTSMPTFESPDRSRSPSTSSATPTSRRATAPTPSSRWARRTRPTRPT